MQGLTAVTTSAVEEYSETVKRGRGLYPIMQVYLCHISFLVGDEDVPSIWREMVLAQTKVEGLALLSQFFLTGMRACL